MNIAVCLKQVPDTAARLKLTDDNCRIDTSALNYVINPYDEYALEEALKLKDADPETKVVVFTLGEGVQQQILRKALAMGADEAVNIQSTLTDAYAMANILMKAIEEHFQGLPDIICAGKEATDTNRGEVAPMIAECLNWPSFTSVVSFEKQADKVVLEREVEGGRERIEAVLPFVFTAQKGLNLPRIPNMKAVMMAKKKAIHEKNMVWEHVPYIETLKYAYPSQKKQGKILTSASELVRALKEEARTL